MKKIILSLAVIAIIIGCTMVSCSKDSVNELLPNANIVLKDGSTVLDETNMGTVVGTKYREMTLITGTKIVSSDEKKVLIYANGKIDGTYPVNISPESLLNFNFSDIKSSTVIYYVSKTEFYILVEGEITLTNTETKMTSGTLSGKVIPANNLTSLEKILVLYDENKTITGDFRAYSVKF